MRRAMFALASACILIWVGPALGQQFTRTEIGFDTSILPGTRFSSATDMGIGGRFTYNFTSSFAIDSEFDSYFTNSDFAQTNLQFGGRASSFLAGPKVGMRARSYGAFFKARPGWMSFSNVFASSAIFGGGATTRKTHAALDLGVAAEFYSSTRTIVRLDVGTVLVRYGDTNLFSVPGLDIRTIGKIDAPWHIAMGVGYRLGSLQTAEERSLSLPPRRFHAGGQYSLMTLERSARMVHDESGVGGWFTWNFNRFFAVDSSVSFFPRQFNLADFQQGGQVIQALAGVRGGVRRGRLGVFGKFRPGIQLYTLTVQNQQAQNLNSFADIALDAGGIIEVYATRRTFLRFDAGNTVIRYRARDVIGLQGQSLHAPAFTKNAIQLTSGVGFSF